MNVQSREWKSQEEILKWEIDIDRHTSDLSFEKKYETQQ